MPTVDASFAQAVPSTRAVPATEPPVQGSRVVKPDPETEVIIGSRWGPGMEGVYWSQVWDDVVRQFGVRVYELMFYDAAVACAFGLWKAGIVSDGLQVTPKVRRDPVYGTGTSKKTKQADVALAQEIADGVRRSLDRLEEPVDEVAEEMLDARAFGCTLAEITWETATDGPDKGKEVLRSIAPKPRWAWGFRVDAYNNIVAVRGWTGNGWEDIDRTKFLIFSWKPRHKDPRGRSDFRHIYNPWNLKLQHMPEFGEYLHHFASPGIAATAGAVAQPTPYFDSRSTTVNVAGVMDQLEEALKAYKGRSYLALPPGSTVTLLSSQGNGEAYHKGFDRFDTEIFRGILFSARPLQEAKFGSRSDSKSGMDLVELSFKTGRQPIQQVFEDQVFYRYVKLNYGEDVACRLCPKASFGTQNSVASDLLAAYAAAYNAGFLDEAQLPVIWERLGLPEISDDALKARLERRTQATDPANGQNTKKSEDAKNPKGPGTSQGKPQKPTNPKPAPKAA